MPPTLPCVPAARPTPRLRQPSVQGNYGHEGRLHLGEQLVNSRGKGTRLRARRIGEIAPRTARSDEWSCQVDLPSSDFGERVGIFVVGVDLLTVLLRRIAGSADDDQQGENLPWMLALGIASRFVASGHDLNQAEVVALHVIASHAFGREMPLMDSEDFEYLREVADHVSMKLLLEPLARLDATMGTPYASVAMTLADRLASGVCELGGPPSIQGQRLRDVFWDEMVVVLEASGIHWEPTDAIGILEDLEANLNPRW